MKLLNNRRLFLIYLYIACGLLFCYRPPLVKNVTLVHQNVVLPTVPVYDTTELQIKVLHNPKYPTTYGIQFFNLDTNHFLKIQKVRFGTLEKIYSDSCQIQPKLPLKTDFEYCFIEPNGTSRFAMEVANETRFKLKCEVYYTINQHQKMNYIDTVYIISCRIGITPGAVPEPGEDCVWSIGTF
ncbi:MAG: hypothetical protein RLZZ628_243 [Bacteroidota bacterium]|jgi:hypothetical protein